MRELQVSAGAAAIVSEQNLRLLSEQAVASAYTCSACERRASSLAEHPASVVVVRDGAVTAVMLAHARASPRG